jgi:hypothetical protein
LGRAPGCPNVGIGIGIGIGIGCTTTGGGGGFEIGEGMLLGMSNDGPSVASVRPPPSSSSHGLSSGSAPGLMFGSFVSSFTAGSRAVQRPPSTEYLRDRPA